MTALTKQMSQALTVILAAERRGGRAFCSAETVPDQFVVSGRTAAALARARLVNIFPSQPLKMAGLTPDGRERAQALADAAADELIDSIVGASGNPYWDAVRDMLTVEPLFGPCLGFTYETSRTGRDENVGRYSWTVTDPVTVEFVALHAGAEHGTGKVIDPLAGSGYWAWLLTQRGIDVHASDLHPPRGSSNRWHKEGVQHVDVHQADAVDAVRQHSAERTLLLSWPPYDRPIGQRALAAYTGNRVIYIGETDGGCCGDDAMFNELDRDWEEVAVHQPVRWMGMRDLVAVYERRIRAIDAAPHCEEPTDG